LDSSTSAKLEIRAGLIACTGNVGCASRPRPNAMPKRSPAGADPRQRSTAREHPSHAACHHSCAQHYIGDIGLLPAGRDLGTTADNREGYHLHVGGGFGPQAGLARE